jgi:DNA-directed RNA polymerase subunit F
LVVLSNAQVAVILQVSAGVATNRDEELNDVYRTTQQYVNRFNTMKNPEKQHQEVVDELDNLQEYVFVVVVIIYFVYLLVSCTILCT